MLRTLTKYCTQHGIFSLAVLLAVVITHYVQISNMERWMHKRTIENDATWYYGYLPMAFIYGDMKMEFLDREEPIPHVEKFWYLEAPNGGKVSKVTMGMAYLYSPFFAAAYGWSEYKGKDLESGYSFTFQRSVYLAGFFYFIAGMVFLWLLLKRYFSEWVSMLVLLSVGLGTNLVYYVQDESLMSHAPGFALITAGMYLTLKFHENPKWYWSVLLGFVAGIMVLVRPINILFVLLPLLYTLDKTESIRWKLAFLRENKWMILLAVFAAFLVYVPQLWYWKTVTGQWLYYSYPGERFFFTKPALLQTLISYRKGWFVYTPVMLFAFLGLFFARKYIKPWGWALIAYVLINIYIISSWWCWWYGGGFGLRAFIDIYGPMALLLGAFLQFLFKSWKWSLIPAALVICGFILLNQYQTYQYRWQRIHFDGMTKEAYWSVFLQKHPPGGWEVYGAKLDALKAEDYDAARRGERFW